MMYFTIVFFFLLATQDVTVFAKDEAKLMILNSVADKLIDRLTRNMKASGTDVMQLPDVDYKEDGALLSQGIIAKKGTFSDLSTIKRSGDVLLTFKENTITVRLAVGIGQAVVHFGEFQAWYGAIVLEDELTVYVNKNSVQVQLTLTVFEDSFKVAVDQLYMDQFGDIIVERKREGELKTVSNTFLTWILSWFQDKIRLSMEDAMKKAIEKGLEKHQLL